MKTCIYGILFTLTFQLFAVAQSQPEGIPLWENGAPGFEDRKDEPEIAKDWWVRNIHNPSVTVFRPPAEKANGCAIVVAPGGGLRELRFVPEGVETAEFLTALGVTVFVLKYRLPSEEHSPYTIRHVREDAYRAIRLVRSRAAEFNIDPNRIGVLGFSAGAGAMMMVVFEKGEGDENAEDPIERANGRPNFQLLIYPSGFAPMKIPADTPPAFLVCANDDEYGCDETTLELFEAFCKADVPVEAHFMVRGKHYFSMGQRSEFASIRNWPQQMADWLSDRGFLKRNVASTSDDVMME